MNSKWKPCDNDRATDVPAEGNPQTWCEWGERLLQYFPWGQGLAEEFQQWFLQLTWPNGGHTPSCCAHGVTWMELAISFTLFRKKCLPILRDNNTGERMILHTESLSHCHKYSITLGDIANTMQLMWGHFIPMVHEDKQPATTRGLCKALIFLGFQQHACGLKCRPKFFAQSQSVRILSDLLHEKGTFEEQFRPDWIPTDDTLVQAEPWLEKRNTSYKERRKHVKRHREGTLTF